MAKLILVCFLMLTLFVLQGQCQTKAFKNVMKYVDSFGKTSGNIVPSGALSRSFGGRGRGMGNWMGGGFRGFGRLASGFMDGGFGSDFAGGYGDMASGDFDKMSGGSDMMSGGMDFSYGFDSKY